MPRDGYGANDVAINIEQAWRSYVASRSPDLPCVQFLLHGFLQASETTAPVMLQEPMGRAQFRRSLAALLSQASSNPESFVREQLFSGHSGRRHCTTVCSLRGCTSVEEAAVANWKGPSIGSRPIRNLWGGN